MKILVNADDFGFDTNRTDAICECFAMGALSQTTAMANMPDFARAMTLAKEKGFIGKVGLHFNLTDGTPLTGDMRSCPVFCNDQGVFHANFHRALKTRLILPPSTRMVIEAESKAQIERYVEAGGTLMHLDSHHHVHTDFSIARVLFPIAKSYGFKTVRMSRTLPRQLPLAKKAYKVVFNAYARHWFDFQVDEMTDFQDFRKHGGELDNTCPVEIMVHPRYNDQSNLVDEKMSLQEEADYLKNVL